MNPAEHQAHWDRIDEKNCKKGRHETVRPIFASGTLGGLIGWRCYCGAVAEVSSPAGAREPVTTSPVLVSP